MMYDDSAEFNWENVWRILMHFRPIAAVAGQVSRSNKKAKNAGEVEVSMRLDALTHQGREPFFRAKNGKVSGEWPVLSKPKEGEKALSKNCSAKLWGPD